MSEDAFKRAVLVDDNSVARAMLRGILRNNRVEVEAEASDGEQALEMVRKVRPDLVCLDIRLRDSDGIEVLKALKKEFPEIPIIMVSGASEPEHVHEALAQGACGFVVKPISASSMLAAIERAFGRGPGAAAPAVLSVPDPERAGSIERAG